MAKTFIVRNIDGTNVSNYSTGFFVHARDSTDWENSTNAARDVGVACTVGPCGVKVGTNTTTGNQTLTLNLSASTNRAITVTSETTGIYKDTGTTTSVGATETWYWSYSSSATTTAFDWVYVVIEPDSGTDTYNYVSGYRSDSGTTTAYIGLMTGTGGQATETNADTPIPSDGTWDQYEMLVTANSKAGDVIYALRDDGATSAIAVTVSTTQTGKFTDTSTVAMTKGDLANWMQDVSSSGAGTISAYFGAAYKVANDSLLWSSAYDFGWSSASNSIYGSFGSSSSLNWETSESSAQVELRAGTCDNLYLEVTANSLAKAGSTSQWAPDADSSVGNWADEGGATSNLFQSIDETTASDTDWVESESNPSSSQYEVGLPNITDPNSSTGHVVRYRYRKDFDSSTINLVVRLKQGTTTIASSTHNGITTTVTAGSFTLTGGEADNITNYNDLRIQFEATQA